jgi:PepSY-associated TM region
MLRRLARITHRLHRLLGSVFALVLCVWFVSGAVMTCADFPSLSEREHLALAPALPSSALLELAPHLRERLQSALARGLRPRLLMLEQQPTWLLSERGVGSAFRAAAPYLVAPLNEQRARAEVEARTGKRVLALVRVDEPDQWSVGLARPGALPFYRAWLDDPAGQQVYLSAHTGDLVQASTRQERALAWLGAIPHWIYPTLLRRERVLWKDTVLVLSGACLLVSLSGLYAGVSLAWARRKKRIHRPVHDRWLRWHQALGLCFGVLVSTWLFSGALSLSPFDFPSGTEPSEHERATLHAGLLSSDTHAISTALARCQVALDVRELELASLGKQVYAVCYDERADSRLVALDDPGEAQRTLAPEVLAQLARDLTVPSARVALTMHDAYDAYHYPTHRSPEAALPYARLSLGDSDQTELYIDPARAELVLRASHGDRIGRWLYHGLHSFDLPGLYEHRVLWRTLLISAMFVGALLSGLGLAMTVRKLLRKRRRLQRA